jgi:glycosyltransferase involved in cell wall biosynthesis
MKIAFFTDDYLPFMHGVTTSIQNYRYALEQLGHEVFIIAPKKRGYKETDDHVIRLFSVNPYIFDKRPMSVLYPGLARRLDKYKFDIVHSHTQPYMGILAQSVARRQGIPHVTTIHTLLSELIEDYPVAVRTGIISFSLAYPVIFKAKPILPFKTRQEIMDTPFADIDSIMKKQAWHLFAAYANHTDGCITPSEHLAESLIKNGLEITPEILPNGVSLDRYQNAKASDSPLKKKRGEKLIMAVARLSGEKRQRVLIDAMQGVKSNARLVLVGDGPERESLEQQVTELGLQDRVVFMGMQSPQNVAALMKQADVFALASYRFDNQPMVILEAIASGLPVVYCDDNLKEGLAKENAYLTSGIDGRHFAVAFDDLLEDEALRKKMSAASKTISRDFDIMRLGKRLAVYYEKQIDNLV